MIVFLMKKDKLEKISLPSVVEGVFTLRFEDKSYIEDINIEASENKWVLNSNDRFTVVVNNELVNQTELSSHKFYKIKLNLINEYTYIYVLPDFENIYGNLSLTLDTINIGKADSNDIIYNFPMLEDIHATIQKENNEWFIMMKGSSLTYLNGVAIKKDKIKVGDVIFIYGLRIIWLGDHILINYPNNLVKTNSSLVIFDKEKRVNNEQFVPTIESFDEISLYGDDETFFHTPRIKRFIEHKYVNIDQPPAPHFFEDLPFGFTIARSITMIGSVMMMFLAVSSTLASKKSIITAIPLLVMGIGLIIASLVLPFVMRGYQKRMSENSEKNRVSKYSKYLEQKENEIKSIIDEQREIMNYSNMSAIDCYNSVVNSSQKIWSRELRDEDFLNLRVGRGEVNAALTIEAPREQFSLTEDAMLNKIFEITNRPNVIDNAPIFYSMINNPISAIVSREDYTGKFLDSLLTQLVSHHTGNELKIVFLLDKPESERFKYFKYLPHLFSDNRKIRYYSKNIEESNSILNSLEEEYTKRKNEISNINRDDLKDSIYYKNFDSYYLIITDNYTKLKNSSFIDKIINSSDNYGFSMLIAEKSVQKLPNQCNLFIQFEGKEGWLFSKAKNEQIRFVPEYSDIDLAELVYRLANIPLPAVNSASTLPSNISFLEMYGYSQIERLNILNRWKNNDPTKSLSVPIGVHSSGDIFSLDLHERFHGPHGLIAGATGSGKSEFIITYLLSLAINFSPNEVQFLIIDYKGGGLALAFNDHRTGQKLPHIAGTITNLDNNELSRALISINSELKRRQRIFNEARELTGESTIDIYKYQKYYREGIIKDPIPHLFIVSDEFAELKAQQPDFMDELISISRIGRSLGIHLILATQKPSGVVNDQIWSNSKFKVSLKVQTKQDSMELLKRPDAATIKETGRFYLQVGYDEFFDIGQSGWAGAKYDPSKPFTKKTDYSVSFINNIGEVYKSIDNKFDNDFKENAGDQLKNIVQYINDIFPTTELKTKKLWLDKLSDKIYLGNLIGKYAFKPELFNVRPIIGEFDDPIKQNQGLLTLDIYNGNTLIYGNSGSGKEMLLSSVLYSTLNYHGPSEIQYYIIDLGAEIFKKYSEFPQVGDVCFINDEDKISKLFVMLSNTLEKRKALFANYSGSYIIYNKTSGKKEPLISVVLNNYESFNENFSKLNDVLTSLLRESHKYGINFIFTTTTATSIRSRLSDLFVNKVCLQMPNESDYRSILGSKRGFVPYKNIGRGLIQKGDDVYEFQTAAINTVENINLAIEKGIERTKSLFTEQASKIPVIPDLVGYNSIVKYAGDIKKIPLGIDLKDNNLFTYDLFKNNASLILSNNISGYKSNLAAIIKVISKLKTTKIIDVNKLFKNNNFEGIQYIDSKLEQGLYDIYKNQLDKVDIVYFIIGIGSLKEKLEGDALTLYEALFSKINDSNVKIVLVDDYISYKKIQTERWVRNSIDSRNGIWLGNDVGSQFAINFSDINIDDRKINFKDMAFICTDGYKSLIKFVRIEDEI